MCTVDVYLDLLEKIGPCSLVFEAESLMPHEIPLAVSRTILELQEKDIGTEDEFLNSFVHRYVALESDIITGEFVKAGDKRKNKGNREHVKVEFQMDTFDREMCLKKMQDLKRKIIPSVISTLKTRFACYEEAIYPKMNWLDPAYWCDKRDFGNDDILAIGRHFEKPLSLALFEPTRVLKEWRSFKVFVKSHYSKLPDCSLCGDPSCHIAQGTEFLHRSPLGRILCEL